MQIPRIFVQTSRAKPEQYVVDMIHKKIPEWKYLHYNDAEIIQFFKENPIIELPNMAEKFYSFNYGEHRADLFRYYFLYIHGGVYMDTDAMLLVNIDTIVKDYTFFSVNSSHFVGTIFQGFIGCTPRNPIIQKALINIYNTPNEIVIKSFHLFCRNLFIFYQQDNNEDNINTNKMLLQELNENNPVYAPVMDTNNNIEVLRHYYADKIIPRDLP